VGLSADRTRRAGFETSSNLSATPRARLPLSDTEISVFCQKHHIRRLAHFGSVLRDDFGPASDVDPLVECEPEHVPGLLKLGAMEPALPAQQAVVSSFK
jgi:hypothetical protein